MKLGFRTCFDPPRAHYACLGPWLFVVVPLSTNRFSAWHQRIGWERGGTGTFRALADAKAWLQGEADMMRTQIGKDFDFSGGAP